MYKYDGVGLAAPQVGMNERMLVFNCDYFIEDPAQRQGEIVMCNPEILEFSDHASVCEEGCLSFPEIHVDIARPEAVLVRYQDLEGRLVEAELDDVAARVFQHEFDHLNQVSSSLEVYLCSVFIISLSNYILLQGLSKL